MKRKLLFILFGLLAFCVYQADAQQSVSGKVTSAEDGSALPGVNVIVQGTTTGTVTDIDGNYTVEVPEGENTLIFSFIGLVTQEIPVNDRSVIDVVMESDVTQLTEVVVTAMGISREKASLTYAQQTIDGEALSTIKRGNFINSLSGKVAGVNIRTNNTMAGSTNITIRGNSSFTNNQPLFVVDGVPISNTVNNSLLQNAGSYGYDYGNPAADINPADIASVSILKGASATALYGSRGQNGVILITTKKGTNRKGIGINISSGVTFGKIDKSTFIRYQNQYGAGYGPYYSAEYFKEEDIDGDGTIDWIVPTNDDGSYGAQFNPNLMVYHWDSFVPTSPDFGKKQPWVPAEHSPVDFFETQTIFNNSIALSGGNENTTFRLSYSNLTQNDILPNSELIKNTINFTAATDLTDNLTADVLFQYNKQDVVGRFSTGYSDNLMSQFREWWEVNVDIKELEAAYKNTGINYTWNPGDYHNPSEPIFWDNPYWTRYENYQSDTRNRIISKIGLNYKFNEWLSFAGRASIDRYTTIREERRAVGSVPTPFGVNGATVDESSGYDRVNIESATYNYNGLLTANKDLSDDFSLNAVLGFNLLKTRYEFSEASTSGGLAVPGLYSLSNSVSSNPFPFEYLWEKELYGYFATANLGFRNFLYVDGSYRIDVSSALPVDNNRYDYWSAGVGFVFSQLVDVNWMDFGKFRASYGTVGNDTRPLRVNDVYLRVDNFGNAILTTLPSTKNNQNLKPEQTAAYEFGLNFAVLDNRLNFDIAYYHEETTNQLLAVDVTAATGYTSKFINAGTIQNQGIELVIGGDIIRNDDFRWNANVNFTKNESEVLDLNSESIEDDPKNYVFASYQGGVTANAAIGEPFGIFKGTGYEYLNGQRVINDDGYYLAKPDQIIGNPNPDWQMGIVNNVSYKGFKLGFLIDISQGGDVFSLGNYYGEGTGIPESTVGLNDRGVPLRYPVSEGGGVLYEGVTEDGEPNTTYADATFYGGAFYWGTATRNPVAMNIFDGSYVKLREVSLTYNLPTSLIDAFATKVAFSLIGRNLWIIHKNLPYADPESGLGAGPAQGYITGAYPSVRSLGFKVEIGI